MGADLILLAEETPVYVWSLDPAVGDRLAADAWWDGYRAGLLSHHAVWTAIAGPVGRDGNEEAPAGIRMHIHAEDGRCFDRDYGLEVVEPLVRRLAVELVRRGVLAPGEPLAYRLEANDRSMTRSEPRRLPVPLPLVVESELPEHLERSAATPILAPTSVVTQAVSLARNSQREVGGGLLGHLCQAGRVIFVAVEALVPLEQPEATETTLRFTGEALLGLREAAHRRGEHQLLLAGWWHSHPARASNRRGRNGSNLWLSENDEFLHDQCFKLPFQTAMVIDPTCETEAEQPVGLFGRVNGLLTRQELHVYGEEAR